MGSVRHGRKGICYKALDVQVLQKKSLTLSVIKYSVLQGVQKYELSSMCFLERIVHHVDLSLKYAVDYD